MTESTSAQDLFKGRHFDQEIIVLCVRWYLTFKLSSRDLVQMMAERGIALAHTTISRWVQRYVPDFEKRWNQYARAVGDSWRVDETYIKVKGQWVYLYRAVDKQGRTVDFESGRFSGVKPLSWLALEGGSPDTSAGKCSPTPRRVRGFLSAGGDALHAGSIPSVVSSPFACSLLD